MCGGFRPYRRWCGTAVTGLCFGPSSLVRSSRPSTLFTPFSFLPNRPAPRDGLGHCSWPRHGRAGRVIYVSYPDQASPAPIFMRRTAQGTRTGRGWRGRGGTWRGSGRAWARVRTCATSSWTSTPAPSSPPHTPRRCPAPHAKEVPRPPRQQQGIPAPKVKEAFPPPRLPLPQQGGIPALPARGTLAPPRRPPPRPRPSPSPPYSSPLAKEVLLLPPGTLVLLQGGVPSARGEGGPPTASLVAALGAPPAPGRSSFKGASFISSLSVSEPTPPSPRSLPAQQCCSHRILVTPPPPPALCPPVRCKYTVSLRVEQETRERHRRTVRCYTSWRRCLHAVGCKRETRDAYNNPWRHRHAI